MGSTPRIASVPLTGVRSHGHWRLSFGISTTLGIGYPAASCAGSLQSSKLSTVGDN